MGPFPCKPKLSRFILLTLSCMIFVHHVSADQPPAILSANHRFMGAQGVNFWNLKKGTSQEQRTQQQVLAGTAEFSPMFFQQPLDHFAEKGAEPQLWNQRYWVSLRHYTPRSGAPVIVLDGGETSGEDRLPFLDTGIVDILAKATGGIGIILEHRYYGESHPVTNLTTDSLRWLNNAQAAADSANFISNIRLPGVNEDITAPNTPWIYYGGSYAGARAAHMKVLYPSLVWGAIASSAVTHADVTNWEYMDIIRSYANQTCINHIMNSVRTIDLLLMDENRDDGKVTALKSMFGLKGLKTDEDFVSVMQYPLSSWQSRNWDPAVNSPWFDEFCKAINQPPLKRAATRAPRSIRINTLSPNRSSSQETREQRDYDLIDLPYGHSKRMVEVELHEGDVQAAALDLDFSLVNYAKYVKDIVRGCGEGNVEECFGTNNDTAYQGTSLDQDWRLWTFQYCTEWGYLTTAPPNPDHPTIISRLTTLEYLLKICKMAFPPGVHYAVPTLPYVTVVNELGDFGLAADRLAFIDGEEDPWRPDTPHADTAPQRPDTLLRPFKIIPGGVHHWDENGLANLEDEPLEIQKIHNEMIEFVKSWLGDWIKERT